MVEKQVQKYCRLQTAGSFYTRFLVVSVVQLNRTKTKIKGTDKSLGKMGLSREDPVCFLFVSFFCCFLSAYVPVIGLPGVLSPALAPHLLVSKVWCLFWGSTTVFPVSLASCCICLRLRSFLVSHQCWSLSPVWVFRFCRLNLYCNILLIINDRFTPVTSAILPVQPAQTV